ncbi:MAG: hypothetical protein ACLRMZ_27400 [Blautia marasmi]
MKKESWNEEGGDKRRTGNLPELPHSELAGQDAVFQITVQSFKRPPELTDDWVAANTDYKTID